MPKGLVYFAVILFGIIGVTALLKGKKEGTPTLSEGPIEISLSEEQPQAPTPKKVAVTPKPLTSTDLPLSAEGLPDANRIEELFRPGSTFPLVETITYKSTVPWLKGRPAWVADYASHYETSRHFIGRSLNGKPDYFKQEVNDGLRFNVLKPGKELKFHLVIDISRCKLWLYAIDGSEDKRYLLKTYDVGLGRPDPSSASGILTPLGSYSLGNKIAIYRPKTTGYYGGEKTEMIRVFGTRWIPFDKEIGNTTAPARGFGIHGVPWLPQANTQQLAEQRESVKKYDSDGCIRLLTEDIEEIYSIIITKPATVELVRDYRDAKLPGKEVL